MVGGWWLLDGMFHQQLATQNATFEETHKKSHRLRLDRMAWFLPEIRKLPFSPYPELYPGQNRIRDGHREAVKGKLVFVIWRLTDLHFFDFFLIRSRWNDS